MIHIKLSMSFPESGARYQANLSLAVLFLILFENVEKPRTLTMHHDLRPYPLKVRDNLKETVEINSLCLPLTNEPNRAETNCQERFADSER